MQFQTSARRALSPSESQGKKNNNSNSLPEPLSSPTSLLTLPSVLFGDVQVPLSITPIFSHSSHS